VLISICIPAYKQPSTLKKLLGSIQIQTFRDFEVIITDDSPGEELESTINENWNFPIRYYKNNPAKGSPGNWNSAIEKAKGEWIKIIHHDDWLASADSLEKFADAIHKEPNIDFFFCKSWIHNTRTGKESLYSPLEYRLNKIETFPAFLFEANIIGAPSAIIYRNQNKFKFDTNLIWLVDIEFYFRLILNGKIHRIDEGLIVIGEEQEFQLTTYLKNNKSVFVREYIYCYVKLKSLLNSKNRSFFRKRIVQILIDFEIKSISEIRTTGLNERIPIFIRIYCLFASFRNVFANRK
jgi:glycosyltransferase involved in cell wall biosynthesis